MFGELENFLSSLRMSIGVYKIFFLFAYFNKHTTVIFITLVKAIFITIITKSSFLVENRQSACLLVDALYITENQVDK